MRAARLVVAVALVAAAAVGGAVATAAPMPCNPGGTTEDVGGSWLAPRPSFPVGGSAVTLAAAPAFDPNLLWATNGSVLMRSEDGGCGWTAVWAATSAGNLPGTTPRITALSVPSSANNSSFVYVGVSRGVGLDQLGADAPTLAVSPDRGRTFVLADAQQGLPPLGVVTAVAANSQVPLVGYAVIRQPGIGGQVYETNDAGTTWTQRTAAGASADLTDFAVHPTTTTELYGISGKAVMSSSDGGATFSVHSPSAPVTSLSVASAAGGVELAAARAGEAALDLSTDRGQSWHRLPSPVAARSLVAFPVVSDQVAVADDKAVWVVGTRNVERSPKGAAPTLFSATAPTSQGFALTGLRDGVVLRLTLDLSLRPKPPVRVNGVFQPVSILPHGRVVQFPSTLTPMALHLTLAAGTTTQVPYQLLLPRTPSKVDLMFLLDSTGSMASVFDALRNGVASITKALDAAGLDAGFGLGDFRDYPSPYGPAVRGDWPYRRDRAIGPADAAFASALNSVSAGGGTTDGGDSPLPALVQSTTGTGDAADGHVFVDPGQDARYRRGALKIAIVAYDTTAHEGGQSLGGVTEPGPTFDSTSATLLGYDVHAMGLAIGTEPLPGLRRIAAGSHTLAPDGGVDCDGNGVVDVPAGQPLVCLIAASASPVGVSINGSSLPSQTVGVAPAVVNLAAGIPDVRPVTLSVVGGGNVVRLASSPVTSVNLRADNQLGYSVSVHCPVGPASRRTVQIAARTPVRSLAGATLTVDCQGVTPVVPGVAPAALAAAAVAAAPVAPGQPVPNANPNPNPNPNPQPAPGLNANPGVASQQEPEGQLAFAEDGPATQLEMSAVRSGAFVGSAGLMLCVAAGVAWRQRASLQRG